MSHYNCFVVLDKENFINLDNKECLEKARKIIKPILNQYYVFDEPDYINFLNNEDDMRNDFDNNINIKGVYSLNEKKLISSYPSFENEISKKLSEGNLEGYEIVDCRIKDLFVDFKDYAVDYCGYKKDYFENKDKFDYYEIGGRFNGKFILKDDIEYKEKGLMLSRKIKGSVDIIRKKDIDIEKQKQKSKKEADHIWDRVHRDNLDFSNYKSWNQLLKEGVGKNEPIESIRAKYFAQKELVKISKDLSLFGIACPLDLICLGDYEKFIEERFFMSFSSYAILKDDKWLDRDDFMIDDDYDLNTFKNEWMSIFNSINDDDWIVNIDCHI